MPTTKHYDLIYDGDGRGLAVVSANDARDHLTVQTWNSTAEGTTTARTFPLSLTAVADIALSPDWRLVAVSYETGAVEVRDAASGRLRLTLDDHSNSVVDGEFSPPVTAWRRLARQERCSSGTFPARSTPARAGGWRLWMSNPAWRATAT